MTESINMSRNSIRNIILVRYIKLKGAKPIARLNMYMVISTVDCDKDCRLYTLKMRELSGN